MKRNCSCSIIYSSVCEALQATGMSACSTTNLFFFSHTFSLTLSSSTTLSNSIDFLSSSTAENDNNNNNKSKATQEVLLIDLGTKCIEVGLIQNETDQLQAQSSTSYYTSLVWKVYSCSLLCLSSLLSTPLHFPLTRCEWKYPRKTLHLQIQGGLEIEEIECVDIQRLTVGEIEKKGDEIENVSQSNEPASGVKKEEKTKSAKKGAKKGEKKDVEVVDLSENLVISKKGVRMIYSEPSVEVSPVPFSSPLNKKRVKGSSKNLILSSKQSSSSSRQVSSYTKNKNDDDYDDDDTLTIMSLLSQHPTMISTLLRTPYFLIKGESPCFTQLMRSLLVTRKLAQATLHSQRVLLFPFTATIAYLFVPAGKQAACFPGFQEIDCYSVLNHASSSDLTYFWRYLLDDLGRQQDAKEVPISGIQPGDLYMYSLIRRSEMGKEVTKIEENADIVKLRSKLSSMNVNTVFNERRGNLSNIGIIMKSQLEDEYVNLRKISFELPDILINNEIVVVYV